MSGAALQGRFSHFIKIGRTGEHLPTDAAGHEAVLDPQTGRMFSVAILKVPNWKKASMKKADAWAKSLRAGGRDDWQIWTADQALQIVDRTRVNPAIDTELFPGTPSDWFWTSTPDCESPSDCAWVVNFNYGYSCRDGRDYLGFVRAVSGGQPLVLGEARS